MATPLDNDKLKRITRRRRALVNEKIHLLSRMQADLQSVCPGLLTMTNNADNVWFLNLLSHADELSKLGRLRQKTLLSIKGIVRKYAAIIGQWQRHACFGHDLEWVGPMIVEDARRVLELKTKIKCLQTRCEQLMGQSPMAQGIDSIPGFTP